MDEFTDYEEAYKRATTDHERYLACKYISEKFPAAYAYHILRVRYSEQPLDDVAQSLEAIPRSAEFWEFYVQYASDSDDLRDYVPELCAAAIDSVGMLFESDRIWVRFAGLDYSAALQRYKESHSLGIFSSESQLENESDNIVYVLRTFAEPVRHFFHPTPPGASESHSACVYAQALLDFDFPNADALLERLVMDNCNCEELILTIYAADKERFAKLQPLFAKFAGALTDPIALLEVLQSEYKMNYSKDLRIRYVNIQRLIADGKTQQAQEALELTRSEFYFVTSLEKQFGALEAELFDVLKNDDAEGLADNFFGMYKRYGSDTALLIIMKLHFARQKDVLRKIARRLFADGSTELGRYCFAAVRGFC